MSYRVYLSINVKVVEVTPTGNDRREEFTVNDTAFYDVVPGQTVGKMLGTTVGIVNDSLQRMIDGRYSFATRD